MSPPRWQDHVCRTERLVYSSVVIGGRQRDAVKGVAKSLVHGLTRTDFGWRLLQRSAAWAEVPPAHRLIATLAPPPSGFHAEDRARLERGGAVFEMNRSCYFQWARSLGLADTIGRVLHRLATGPAAQSTTGSTMMSGAFWDVGANVGYYSVLMSRWTDAIRPVVAVEPGSVALAQLRRHLSLNEVDRAVVVPKAVSDEVRVAHLFTPESGDVGKSSLSEHAGPTGETIDVTTLDHIWNDLERHRVALMKIDVEGLEGEALLGARALIAHQRPDLVVELSPAFNSSAKVEAALEFLSAEGYGWAVARDFVEARTPLRPVPPGDLGLTHQADIVFRPSERAFTNGR